MTAEEKKKILAACIVPGDLFNNAWRTLWGIGDDSRNVFHSMKDPLIINGSKPYAAELLPLVREVLEQPYFGEYEAGDRVFHALADLVGVPSTAKIIDLCNCRWQYIRKEEAIDRAKAFVASVNIVDEIDRIDPDPLYNYFHKAVDRLDNATDALFLYGYYCGLDAARKAGQA